MAISAEDVRNVTFGHSSRLKHGYDVDEVDDFLDEVALVLEELQVLRAQRPSEADNREVAELRHRVRELESRAQDAVHLRRERDEALRELAGLRADAKGQNGGIDSRAVNLLSQAQASADQTIAEADLYAQELVTSARRQFQEILSNARAVAIHSGLANMNAETSDKSEPDMDRVRSFAEQAQSQLDALLATLTPDEVLPARDSGVQAN